MPTEKQEIPKPHNYFTELNDLNLSDKTEEKNKLTYLPWASAWAEIKKRHPAANYIVYERPDGRIYWDDGKTAWVKTGAIIDGIEHIEYLPVMNHANKSISVEALTSFEVNKTIQRSLTKAFARHGLGLYIYIGEDLPQVEIEKEKEDKKAKEALDNAIDEITDAAKTLVNAGNSKDVLYEIIAKHNDGSKNPANIKSLEVCNAIKAEFAKLSESPATENIKTKKSKNETKNEENN